MKRAYLWKIANMVGTIKTIVRDTYNILKCPLVGGEKTLMVIYGIKEMLRKSTWRV